VRVCVVGAGFAGLAAAADLAAAGVDVIVLEARARVGGRVWSQRFDPSDPESPVIERGGEFLLAGFETTAAYAASFGLVLADTGMSYYVRTPVGVPGVDAPAMIEAGRRLAAALDDADRDGRPAGSVTTLLRSVGLDPAVAEAVLARVETSCAQQAELLDAKVLRHLASLKPQASHRVAGGNEQIAVRLAHELGGRVHRETPVRSLSWTDDGVRLATAGGAVDADRVIIAVPLPILRELPMTPGMPPWKHRVWASAVVGMAAKLHVAIEPPVATTAVMSVPDRFWSWTARDDAGGIAPVLGCFAGSPDALDRLQVESGPDRWLGRLAATRPDLTLDPSRALLTAWTTDPWARCGSLGEGVRDEVDMNRPVGPVHFAGEHTAGEWAGLMEGALRSGRRAAADVLAAPRRT
jgi:monoamine oxidase